MADIPGLIEGASEGTGLGIRFLRHLSRTRLLLHLVDAGSPEPTVEPSAAVRSLAAELEKYDAELAQRERWLVLNKMDLVPRGDWEARQRALEERLDWKAPCYAISALSGEGCRELSLRVMEYLEAAKASGKEPPQD